jgi:secondary thiamine-phosphate synthase enzyme
MKQAMHTVTADTRGQGLYDVTSEVSGWVARQGIRTGLLTVFCRHTSASLTIQENADPDVLRDLQTFFARLVREDPSLYRHTDEGPDDMPAHIRSALTGAHLSIPVSDGRAALGTWQGIYLFEHRVQPHTRRIVLHLVGE